MFKKFRAVETIGTIIISICAILVVLLFLEAAGLFLKNETVSVGIVTSITHQGTVYYATVDLDDSDLDMLVSISQDAAVILKKGERVCVYTATGSVLGIEMAPELVKCD